MADKYDKLMTELRGMVKCPVCLSIPEEGPIPSCPRGHLVCQPCHHGMIEGKLSKCPTCREPMGKTFSLLAKKLIESMDNNCTNEGCSKIFLNQELTKHIEELCEFRKVRCPGRNPYCEAEIPFHAFNDHIKDCQKVVIYESNQCTVLEAQGAQEINHDDLEGGNASGIGHLFGIRGAPETLWSTGSTGSMGSTVLEAQGAQETNQPQTSPPAEELVSFPNPLADNLSSEALGSFDLGSRIDAAMDRARDNIINRWLSERNELLDRIAHLEDRVQVLSTENNTLRSHAGPEAPPTTYTMAPPPPATYLPPSAPGSYTVAPRMPPPGPPPYVVQHHPAPRPTIPTSDLQSLADTIAQATSIIHVAGYALPFPHPQRTLSTQPLQRDRPEKK